MYFAYIDKSMGSKVQIEQLIGRVLRQPGATHYAHPILNTAHFYVRVDKKSAFQEVLSQVEAGLGDTDGEVRMTSYETKEQKSKAHVAPRKKLLLEHISFDQRGPNPSRSGDISGTAPVEAYLRGIRNQSNIRLRLW